MNFKKSLKAGVAVFLLFISVVTSQTLQDGQKKIEMKQYESAKKTFKAILQSDPSNIDALFYLGKTYWIQQKNDSASIYFQKIASINSESPLGYIGQGYIFVANKDDKNAQIVFKKALNKTKSKDPSTYMNIAEAYIYGSVPNLDKALENLNEAKDISKDNTKLFVLIGDAYATKFDGKGMAMTNYELATDINKNYVLALFKIGELDNHSKNYKDAEPALVKVKQLDSLYVPVYPELGELYYYTNRLTQAKEMYRIYLSLSDYDLDAMVRYASFLYICKDYENAINEIKKIQAKDSSYLVFNRLLGYSYYEVKKYQDGISPLKKYIDQAVPEKVTFMDYDYYSKMLMQTGQDSLAYIWMRKAYNKDTSHIEILGAIADSLSKKGKYKDAAIAYQYKISKSYPPSAADYFQLGRSYYNAATYDTTQADSSKSKLYNLADTAFVKLINVAPTYIPGYLFRVRINVYYKDTAATTGSAEAICDSFITKLKKDTVSAAKYKREYNDSYKYLAVLYIKKNNLEKGREYLMKAREVDPADTQTIELLKSLQGGQ
jgi:tetratricopeptide (TPR) repeat protein